MWLSKIKNKKFQMLLIGIVVLVSSMMLTSAFEIIMNIDKPINELIKETNAPTVYAIVSGVADTDKEVSNIKNVFQKDPDVKKVLTAQNVKYITSKIMAGKKEIELSTKLFMRYKDGEFGKIKFLKGKKSLKDGECFITSIIAQTYKLSLGDFITVKAPKGDIKLKVVGIYSDAYSVSSFMDVDRFYVSENQLNDIAGYVTRIITVYGKDGANSDSIVKNYRENINRQMPVSLIDISVAKLSAETVNKILGAFTGAFAIIILLVSTIVIRASILDSIAKEYKIIGTYKTIGYSSQTIMSIYMKAYSFIVIIFAFIGAILSGFITKYILGSSFKVYGIDFNVVQIYPMLITVAFITVLMLGVIYSIVRKTKSISPVEVFRMGMPVNNKKGTALKSIETKFTPMSQALRKMFYYKKLSIILFSVLFACSYMVDFSIVNYSDLSVFCKNSTFWCGIDDAQFRIRIKDTNKSPEVDDWIKNSDKVKNCAKASFEYPKIVISKDEINGSGSLLSQVYDTYGGDIKEEVIEGKNPENENETSVSKKLLEKTHKKLGDYISMYINGTKKDLLITGTYQSMINNGMSIRVLESTVKSTDESYVNDTISFNLKNPKDYDSFKKAVKDKFKSALDVEKSTETFSSMLGGSLIPMKASLTPFIITVIIVGAVNVFSIIFLMNMNSRKESCIYKAIGYNTFDLIKGNLFYILMLAVAAIIISIPVFCVTFSRTMNLMMSTFGIYDYPADIRPQLLAAGSIASIAVYILCTLISSLSIVKLKIQELNEVG